MKAPSRFGDVKCHNQSKLVKQKENANFHTGGKEQSKAKH